QVNRCALRILCQVKLRAVLDFDYRTITETYKSVCVLGRSQSPVTVKLFAAADQQTLRVRDLKNLSFRRLDRRFKLTAERRVTLDKRQCQQAKPDHDCRGNSPPQHNGLNT